MLVHPAGWPRTHDLVDPVAVHRQPEDWLHHLDLRREAADGIGDDRFAAVIAQPAARDTVGRPGRNRATTVDPRPADG